MSRTTLPVLAVVSLAAPALADDLFPAPWRFLPGTTVQHWDFTAGPGGGAPDALPLNNPFGSPMMSPGAGAVWFPAANGRTDIWDLSGNGSLTFDIPNTGNQNNQKEVWLQVTYFSAATTPPPSYTVTSSVAPFTQISSQVTPLPGGWFHELTRWATPVCPPVEKIAIFPSQVGAITLIDQVVVDTRCFPIPTPGAATALALGGLVALRRRR
jgi:hypothetical protein